MIEAIFGLVIGFNALVVGYSVFLFIDTRRRVAALKHAKAGGR